VENQEQGHKKGPNASLFDKDSVAQLKSPVLKKMRSDVASKKRFLSNPRGSYNGFENKRVKKYP
jgi:hypothetical protein